MPHAPGAEHNHAGQFLREDPAISASGSPAAARINVCISLLARSPAVNCRTSSDTAPC